MTREEAKEIIDTSDYFWLRPTEEEYEALNLASDMLEKDDKRQWIPVSQELPIDNHGADVLACDIDGDIYKAYLSDYDGWRRSDDFEKIKSVVAWMPLPEPYKGATGCKDN